MKVIFLGLLFIGIALGAPSKDDLTIKEFEAKYHDFFEDPEKEKEAADQLAKEEEDIDKENELFAEGKAHFSEQLQPWDILSKEEFEKEKEGLLPGSVFTQLTKPGWLTGFLKENGFGFLNLTNVTGFLYLLYFPPPNLGNN